MIAEDSGLLRQMLVDLLTDHGCVVTGVSDTKEGLLPQVAAAPPDVVLLDIRLRPGQRDEGLQAAEEIRARHPDVGLLVLSQYAETSYAIRLLEAAAHSVGYLVKDRVADGAGLVDALTRVARGETVIDPDVVARLVRRKRSADPLERLTPAERDVLALVAQGRSNVAIAEALSYSVKTVEKRITAISQKLRLPTGEDRTRVNLRVLAVLTYLRTGGS
jgi:DNA-binding NarL/FixJ family response regulator